jgi:hypothetical protein
LGRMRPLRAKTVTSVPNLEGVPSCPSTVRTRCNAESQRWPPFRTRVPSEIEPP